LVYDHLRRSFTAGDQNYDAQFWFGREAFILGNFTESRAIFDSLGRANLPAHLRNQIRGVISDESGRSRVYIGDVVTIEDAYMFIHCPDFTQDIFVHRTRFAEEEWVKLKRGDRVAFTIGFSMRGPTAASIHPTK